MSVSTVAVIGAGTIGRGVAASVAQAGVRVLLLDTSEEALRHAPSRIRYHLRQQKLLAPASLAGSTTEIVDRVECSGDYTRLAEADFIIENIPEKWELKKSAWQRIDAVAPAHCVMASNTSVLSITRIASLTRRPERVVGLHFMNPAPLKAIVEVIPGYRTSQEVIETTRNLLARMKKECVVVQDMPGFVSNRLLMSMINEAVFLVQDGVASVEEVDRICKSGFGHAMGPLETADLIGLDTVLHSIQALYDSYHDVKYRPCLLLKKMVDAGLRGRKSGKGFYEYHESPR